jgi:hypothetical protein
VFVTTLAHSPAPGDPIRRPDLPVSWPGACVSGTRLPPGAVPHDLEGSRELWYPSGKVAAHVAAAIGQDVFVTGWVSPRPPTILQPSMLEKEEEDE